MPFNNRDQQKIDQIYSDMRKESMYKQKETEYAHKEILEQGFKKIFADSPGRGSTGLRSINKGVVVYHNPNTSELILIDGTNEGLRGKTDRVQDFINFLYDDNNTTVTFGNVYKLLDRLPRDLQKDINTHNFKRYRILTYSRVR